MKSFISTVLVCIIVLAALVNGQHTAPSLDTRPAFMQILTNYTVQTKMLIVTNYLSVTNAVVATNFYNAQGQLLQPVPPAKPSIPGLIPIPSTQPVAPDPAVVKAQQLQAVRDLLTQSLLTASNKVCAAGAFTGDSANPIPIPQGVTSLDRNRTEALLTTMNVTAEKAAPDALAVVLKSAAQFQAEDPGTLVKGASDAATRAWLAAHQEALEREILAVVQQAGVEPKLREAYRNVMFRGGGLLGSVLGTGPSVDIETHVAQHLFQKIVNQVATQEAVIRSTPKARKTPALKKAFAK